LPALRLIVSLVVSAGLAALSKFLEGLFPSAEGGRCRFSTLSFRPHRFQLCSWPSTKCCLTNPSRGAMCDIASSFGADGALIVLLVWIYYTAPILMLGAEFSRAFAHRFGSHARRASQRDEERAAEAAR
jgi:membrane protein